MKRTIFAFICAVSLTSSIFGASCSYSSDGTRDGSSSSSSSSSSSRDASYFGTPLHYAILQGNHERAWQLIEFGHGLSEPDSRGQTALDLALECDNEMVRQVLVPVLLEAMQSEPEGSATSDPFLAYFDDSSGYKLGIQRSPIRSSSPGVPSPVFEQACICIANDKLADLQTLLQKNPGLVNVFDEEGFTLLHHAVDVYNPDMIRALRRCGADPHEKVIGHKSAFELAYSKGNQDVLDALTRQPAGRSQALYDVGAIKRVERCDDIASLATSLADLSIAPQVTGFGAFKAALVRGNREALWRMLANGFNVNVCDAEGQTPLHLAASRGDKALVQLLLEYNAPCNVVNKEGQTPLHVAAKNNFIEVLGLILEQGNWTDINVRDKNEKTAYGLASSPELKSLLEALGGTE
ncbi:ankyrin repeat domain-containing protein [Candidatus Babeliales bacterium]|nr:ankyrin repeat domain-containing protein [Candidatus Babeliales bacterium]